MRAIRSTTLSQTPLLTVGAIVILVLVALVGAVWPRVADAQSQGAAQVSVSVAARLASDGLAEFCLDLRDPSRGETRLCPDRRRLAAANAPEGRWLGSASVHIAPESSLWIRVRRNGDQLRLALGVNIEGERRGVRRTSWLWSWADARADRWQRTSSVTIDLPAPTHPELWEAQEGIAFGAPRLQLNRTAPEFHLPELGSNDDLIQLSEAREGADITLIVFWSSFAPYVPETLSAVSSIARADDSLVAIGVNVYDVSSSAAQSAAERYGAGMLHLVDQAGAVAHHYRVDGPPEIFVLDERGVYRAAIHGAAPITEIRAVIRDVRRGN